MRRKPVKKEKNLKEIYLDSFEFMKQFKNYIFFAASVFLFFCLIGYFFEIPLEIEKIVLEKIKEIGALFEGKGIYETTWMIFSNNIYVCFMSVVFGIFLGIVPLVISITNGFMIGFVSKKAVEQEGILTLWRLFPHGIFELPAVIISLGLGIKLGITFITNFKMLKKEVKRTAAVFTFIIVPLIVLAAIIEGVLVSFFK